MLSVIFKNALCRTYQLQNLKPPAFVAPFACAVTTCLLLMQRPTVKQSHLPATCSQVHTSREEKDEKEENDSRTAVAAGDELLLQNATRFCHLHKPILNTHHAIIQHTSELVTSNYVHTCCYPEV